ncbi:MAG: mechanosensitive ion channel family protein [Vicinamibacterales bacterium]
MTGGCFHVRTRVAAFILLSLLPGPARAQEKVPPQVAADLAQLELQVPTAPVMIDGVAILRVRGVSSYPSEQRAAAIAGRIRALAADGAFKPETLRVEETEVATQIMADRLLVMGVFDADAAVEGMDRKVLGNLFRDRIRAAIVAYRTERGAPALERAAAAAAVATLVFVVLVVAVIWLRRGLDAMLDSRYRHRIDALAARSQEVVSVERVWGFLDAALRFVRSVVIVVLALAYVQYVFGLFPYTRPAARSVTGYVVGPLATMWASFVTKIPDLIFLAILVVVVRIILRVIRRFFEAVEQSRIHLPNFDREWATPTYKLLRPMVIAFAIVVGYPYIPGSGSEAFKGVSLFLGIVFSLGSSSFIANMIAGYSMTYRRAFKLGDVVRIGEVMGVVSSVRLQVTHVRTTKNEEVVVPNSQILNASVTNFSSLAKSDGLILHTTVGIGYETPWRQVEAMLLEAARRTPGLMTDPPPFVFHLQLGDFCVTYELNVYCSEPLGMRRTYTELHRHILDVFNEYGVQIMTPAYEGDPEIPKVVPKDQWYLAPARTDAS